MQLKEIVRHIVDKSGRGYSGVSRALHKDRNYLTTTLARGAVPRVDTLANIAEATGYKLVLKGHGEEIVIDPTIDISQE